MQRAGRAMQIPSVNARLLSRQHDAVTRLHLLQSLHLAHECETTFFRLCYCVKQQAPKRTMLVT